ncbi:MAG: hypothetical protein JNK85_21980 [Verrucomicrobiales bacterium]|nr:hypothetical protein [Verrucomicrobiales bacterium]
MKTPTSLSSPFTNSARRPGLLLAVLAALAFGAGCQRPANQASNADISATYRLADVDGKAMPASVNHDGTRLEIRAGEFVIRPDGTCSSETTFVPPSGTEVHRKVDAKYTRTDNQLRMKWQGAGITLGSVTGDRFTMTNEGMVFVYRR